jgi:hypothetical protein
MTMRASYLHPSFGTGQTAENGVRPERTEGRSARLNVRGGQSEIKVLASDPLKTGALGWLSGELGRSK